MSTAPLPLTASVQERSSMGRGARESAPRSSHATFTPAAGRDPVAILQEQSRSRVPDLVPIRYGRMLVSPFTFYRGGAAIMARDLATCPTSGLTVQSCGDAHLLNFGVFASPERKLVFDLNDFDETHPGPFEWDVKRLAASILIAAQDNQFTTAQGEQAVLTAVLTYRETMRQFATTGNLDVWYAHLDMDQTLKDLGADLDSPGMIKRTKRGLDKARTRDSLSAFNKLTEVVNGERRIVDQSPLIVPIGTMAGEESRQVVFDWIGGVASDYAKTLPQERRMLLEQFDLVDVAHKVVGVGSVGTQAWIALLLGHDNREPLFLQLKQAQPSVLEAVLEPSEFEQHGERVVVGQRMMQASSDIFLGWVRVNGLDGNTRDFYVRQLRDWKGSVNVETMRPEGLNVYSGICGWTLARAHARTGDRVAISAYLGKSDRFDRAILEFSKAYAAQNELDYAALQNAADAGTIPVLEGL